MAGALERIATIESKVEDISHRLFGNGDEGEISRMGKLIHTNTEDIRDTNLSVVKIRSDIRLYFAVTCTVIVTFLFLSGNGRFSLDSVIQAFTKVNTNAAPSIVRTP